MSAFALVSVPAGQHTLQELRQTLPRGCSASELGIPLSRVGTLDELVALCDELMKHDSYMETVANKIAHALGEMLQDKAKLREALLADSKPIDAFVGQFDWDSRRYNAKQPIRDLAQTLTQQVTAVETDLKARMQAYSKVKGALQAVERKNQGSLLIRSLSDIVKPEHVVQNSEFLTTLMVVVPKYAYNDWKSSYSTLTDYVCPGSTQLIHEDSEYGLFSVTLFRRIADDFRAAAREKKFTVRDFEFDEETVAQQEADTTHLANEFKEKHARLMDWLQLSFDQCFTAWMHLKALRLFVESVLRYGLPPKFSFYAVSFKPDEEKRMRTALQRLYGHLDKAGAEAGEVADVPGLFQGEYFPYVSFSVRLDHFVSKK
ncbi:hypothetical protein PTSG_05481 [Salpingoeca rosetta]|uniref:V-type proton ATPase subunit C n=1 Tax=Salpingoeca rosetta (strain ATCC 50818 / BSB-021) TaxID=946362 RepID=F2UBC2_SALR5|nr:uncharacterized protein PTSG_05481 [Salpingoeca rosetta]EGD73788.1 hypothetical protein PTSG_05481 [Salpingoeca rosetta]|eukprot:XP_004993351.1 hypothetical protein PTSG_05481 [Salpingoeca rosetta]